MKYNIEKITPKDFDLLALEILLDQNCPYTLKDFIAIKSTKDDSQHSKVEYLSMEQIIKRFGCLLTEKDYENIKKLHDVK